MHIKKILAYGCISAAALMLSAACASGAEKKSATAAVTSETTFEEVLISEAERENQWRQAYTNYLNECDFLGVGIFCGDINGDDIPEMIVLKTFGVTDVVYYNESGIHILNFEHTAFGYVTFMEDTKQILFTPMIAHTDGTAENAEYFLYGWNGSDYVLTKKFFRRSIEYGAYINDEKVDNDEFEKELRQVTDIAPPILNNYYLSVEDENFENYIKENFPEFTNWDCVHKRS